MNVSADDGYTPLHVAVRAPYGASRGHVDVVYTLIAHGADLQRRTRDGKTARQLCAQHSACAILIGTPLLLPPPGGVDGACARDVAAACSRAPQTL